MWIFETIVVLAMIGINSVFAAYELALASVGRGRLEALAEQGRRGAASALKMKQDMEASLAVVQLGITLAGATAAATGGAGAEEGIEPLLLQAGVPEGASQLLSIALVVAPLTAATIIFGELVPKVFALRNQEWVCLRLSRPMQIFAYLVWPLVWVLESAVGWIMRWGGPGPEGTEAGEGGDAAVREIYEAAAHARNSRLIGQREHGIIVSASRLAATPLRRIMLPANYIDMLHTRQTLAEALVVAHQEMHTRFPVTEEAGNPQRIIGYVNFKDIVAALRIAPSDPSLERLVRRLSVFHANASVADCLENLMRQRNHIALVKETTGAIVGMVTLEDIVEELVGEIHDEFDRMPAHLTAAGHGWIAGGFVSLAELSGRTGIELKRISEKPLYTLNDWIVERLGRPPRGGDEIDEENCRIVIRKTRHTLVQEAHVQPKE